MTMNILPEIQIQTIAIKVKPKVERMIKRGHPWLFEDAIVKQNKPGTSGDIVIIFGSKDNKFIACGLYDPFSPIRVKILQYGKGAKINADFFSEKVARAFNKRKPLLETATNSYRFLFGEADAFPGFIADVYANVLVIKLYATIWLPYLNDIVENLIAHSNCDTVVLRLSRNVQKQGDLHGLHDGKVIYGNLVSEVVQFEEHGVQFSANVIHGHKTGYFLDHRDNRRRVGAMAEGKTVLDVFSYAGGFSVHALANGAKRVISLDISAQALEVAKYNGNLNSYTGTHETMAIDAFEGLKSLIEAKESFDIVVIDPPSFAKSAKEIDKAKNSYERLARLGAQLVRSGGMLVLASCSSRIIADEFFEICGRMLNASGKRFQLLDTSYHDVDHPVIESFPEGAYLKCGYYRLLS